MSELSGRRLLQGMAALPLAGMAGRFAPPAFAMAGEITRVNVIVHGFGVLKVIKLLGGVQLFRDAVRKQA